MKRFLFAMMFCAAICPVAAQVSTADSTALVSLYNSTNGASWTNRTNWKQPGMLVGSWFGVVVSGGRVIQINLPLNNLTGTMPNLSALTALTRLDIANDHIGGVLPTTLTSLTALQHLDLRGNNFNSTFPNLGGLTNLKYLSIGALNSLQFGQPFPAFVVGLTQLEYLGLDNNRFTGTIPAGFSNLTHLKELTMATLLSTPSNDFITELGTIQALRKITLVSIPLGTFTINLAPLGGLTHLELLDIRSTSTSTLPPPNVWVSDSLTIDISNNVLDFGDLEIYHGITQPTIINTGQALLPFSAINPGTATLVEGDPFSLQTAFGGTQNNYVWQKATVPIPGQTGPTLNFDSIEASDAGTYRLQMTSTIVTGITLTTTNITLIVTPRVQSRFAIQQHSALTQEIGASSYGGYWADIDRDGDEDLFVNNAFDVNPNFLYQNNADGTFTKVTTGDITSHRDPSRYVSWGDYDNDGYPDIFTGDYVNGDDISSLYHNNGNSTFNRIPFNHKSDGGLWADYDNDGDLDLSVMVTSALPVSNKLYKNKGDGTFEVIENFVPFTSTWVAGWVDMDNDNDLDYFLTDGNFNPSPIRLFRNDQGVFTASTVPLPSGNFMVRAISWADIDGDGDQDFFAENQNGVINSTAESQFYINDGTGQFTRENASSRMGGLRVTGARGTVFGDADNDGDLDLFVNHKHLTNSNDVIVQLFLNNGSGSFTVVPVAEQSFGISDFGTNMSLADYNNDGFLDLFIANFDILIPNRLCRNLQTANGNHWIKLNLEGVTSNKSAIGARVDIYSGGHRMTRQVLSSSGLSSQNSLLVHSGLALATQADSVHIFWPSGFLTKRFNLAADQTHAILETTDLPPTTVVTADSLALVDFYNATNGPNWTTKTNWLAGKVNTWYGVTVDSSKRVSGIALPNNLLFGAIPESFSTLTGLKNLILPVNTIRELPNNFNSLTALEKVNLNSNTTLASLPSFSGLTQLDSLIVTNCRLTFEDLEPVASLSGIQYIPQSGFVISGAASIVLGSPYTIAQPVGGSANSYQWFKGAIPVGTNSDTYIISAVTPGDAGTYSLEITNPLVPGLTLTGATGALTIVSPGAQNYFSWPPSGGTFLDTGADSYGGYWVDIDNDGDDDLAVNNLNTQGDLRSVDLYENINGTFTRLTSANMPVGDGPRNLTWADSDNDGDLDFYLGDAGLSPQADGKGAFYRNNGDKTFTRIDLNQNADGGAWIDYNNDGRVDLFTVDAGQPTSVFRNDSTAFTQVPGVFTQGSDWTLSFADIDSDRDMDLVQLGKSPNTGFNNLYRNDSSAFTYLSSSIISTDNLVSARGGSWADIDNDGDMDFFGMNASTGGSVESAFYLNNGTGGFVKQISTAVLGADVRGRASSFGDVDNDGDVDLVISNGKAGNTGTKLFLNNGNGTFSQATDSVQSFIPVGAATFAQVSLGDANSDGFLDIFAATFSAGQPATIYRNNTNSNNWVKFRLQGVQSNRSAVGARIETRIGGARQIREVTSQTGLASQNSLVQHFGIASALQVDTTKIYWPSGAVQVVINLPSNQVHSIMEGVTPPSPTTVIASDSLALVGFYNATNGPNWATKTNWLTGKANTWYGITVDSSKRVSGISLPNNLLFGSIPESFSALTGLKTLILPVNAIRELPNNFNTLTGLVKVNLNSNTLASLPSLTGMTLDSLIVTNCRLTFEDLEPVASMSGIRYDPQTALVGSGSASIVLGSPYTITQPVGGSANSYQWSKSGVPIPGATTDMFFIPAVSVADAGNYAIEVTSSLVPGLTLGTVASPLTIVSPGAQTYFSWPPSGGTFLEAGADSYGGYWVDIDNDGDDDLAVNNLNTQGDLRSVDLYENINGTFSWLTSANMPVGDGSRNLTWADSDNDGDLDFYLGDAGLSPQADGKGAFYRNNGNKTFTRIDLNQNADGGAWIDYNNDGRVDLFTVDAGQPTSVFRNDSTTFTQVPGVFTQGSDWTLAFADIDSDRDMDLVQLGRSPNTGFNNLYRNDSGAFTFLPSSIISTDNLVSARGGSWADIDNDGDMDFFGMNASPGGSVQSAFYVNNGTGSFVKQTSTAILGADVRGRASSFGDIDNDGDVDLVISNGKAGNTGTKLFLNNGNGTFSQATDSVQSFIPVGAATFAQVSLGDANSDGFLDIFAATFSAAQPATIYRNNTNSNKWIKFRLQGVQSNRSAVGARIEIRNGGGRQIREVTSQTGLASQNSLVQHFGIANATQVDTAKIYWPSGAVQLITNIPGNLVHTVIEGTNPPTNTVTTSDSLVLVAFYNAMNGPNWPSKANWLSGKVNTWYGITVSNQRVAGISLPNNQVTGVPPSSFTSLAGLTSLNLSFGSIGTNGVLPTDFSNLNALTYLNLHSSGLTQLAQVSGLTELDSLIVTSNNLTFEDLEPFASTPGIRYAPQNPIGTPSSSNIVSGNPWTLSIHVGGSANQYQWLKAGIPIGVVSNTLLIPSVSGPDAGSYQLVITNPLVPGLTLSTAAHTLAVVAPGAQTYFTWPQNDGIINGTPSDSYGGYWADIDDDGDDDLAINNLQQGLSGRSVDLYENNNGVFTRLLTAGMPTDESTRNVTWADYDNDGDLDFYLGDIGFNLLSDFKGAFYRNNGDKTFTRVVHDQVADGGMWHDYDKDGLVDLFTVDAGQTTKVYRNLGGGNFALAPVEFSQGSDWTLAFADIDNDRDMDLVQVGKAPNTGFNNLYRNDSIGVYSYQSSSIISTDNLLSARGGSWADIDNDGDMDFFAMSSITGGSVQSAFYFNDGAGNFTKQTSTAVLGADVRGRSSSFGDLDNDGDVDLVVHNGRAGNLGVNVYLNNGGGAFSQIPAAAQTFIPIASPTLSQVSLGDANGDGFLDILSTTFSAGQPAALYRNVGNGNKWIKFRLFGDLSNRSGIGARIEVHAGGLQIREVTSATGLASQNSLVQHFGLDSAAQVDSVKIYWPSGIVQQLTNLGANQTVTVVEEETIFQQEQGILSTAIPFKAVGEAPFALQATSTSGLPVQFTSSDSTVATIVNNMAWVWGPGTTTITMNQPGNSNYFPAPETSQSLTVYPAEGLTKTLVTTMHLGGAQNHGTIISVDDDGSNSQVLHVFDSIQGHKPTGQMLNLPDGFLYGTTARGGSFDRGTIYRIKPDGSEFQVLHMFDIANGADPYSGLIQASDGSLYGTTGAGGPANFGTVYKINTDGSGFTKLHDFGAESLGYSPYGRLLQATNGYLYGTTVDGGANFRGTLFRIRTNGAGFETLHSFQESTGASPYGGVYQAANGKIYGGLYSGGASALERGALFRIELDGTGFTTLYDFSNAINGSNPFYGGVLTQGRDGSLFGTASSGGTGGGGTVFKLNTDDSTVVSLKNFGGINGSSPIGSVVIGPDGYLYGLTLYAGENDRGVLFRVGQDGTGFTKVLDMTSETGSYPFVTSPTLVYSAKFPQTITFDSLAQKVLGDAPFALTATASSGLQVNYASSNPSVAYVQSDTVFIVAAGSTIITARQPGNNLYLPADSVSQVLTVIDNVIRPTIPSTNLVFTNVFSTQMNVSFTPGNGEKHLVAMRAGAPVTWTPIDGEHYNGRLDFANAIDTGDGTRIISSDSAVSMAVTALPPGALIHVRVFEFNGDDFEKYLVSSTLIGSRATLALPNVFVTAPANNAVNQNVALNVSSSNLVGATTYTIELDTVPYFASPLVRSGARTQNFTGLSYGRLYYSRVKTNLSPDYGPLRSFSTAEPEFFSYVVTPANNATGVTLTNLARSITMNNVVGATTYTCELNTLSNFTGISQVKSGGRIQTFTGLSPGTTYYSRVSTDLSPNWGQTRQFTTAGASSLTFVMSPANNAVNVSYQPSVTVTDVGAGSYTVQLSPTSDFTASVVEQTAATRTMSFSGLAYNTVYYSRARTELDSAWGPNRSFTTTSPLAYSYVTNPANNAVNVPYVVNISANIVPAATTYTIEANTQADFGGTSIVHSGGRTLNFTLAPNQTYYVRVSTDLLPGQWGVTRSFTTISSVAYSYITSPASGATNVPYVTNVTAYNVPLATSFIIEANTLPDFTGTSIVKMGTVRTYSFTLAYDQVYYVRVQTNLAPGQWGQTRSFTTGSPQSLAYVTSPANGVVGVPTTVNVTSNLVPTATSYIIELNPDGNFAGIPIIRTGASRTKNFTGLGENRTYYSRVSTNLTPGVWGPTRSFTTVNPGGRQAGEAWVASTDEDPLVPDEITEVRVFPNPFTDQFDVHVQTTDQRPLEVQLTDITGRTVFEARDWMTNRLHTVRGEFSPGVYLLELNTEGTRRVIRVVRR